MLVAMITRRRATSTLQNELSSSGALSKIAMMSGIKSAEHYMWAGRIDDKSPERQRCMTTEYVIGITIALFSVLIQD